MVKHTLTDVFLDFVIAPLKHYLSYPYFISGSEVLPKDQ